MSQDPLRVLVILGSNRPGRFGERIGEWVLKSLEAFPQFEVDFADLATMDLGFSLSAHHPRTGIYEGGAQEFAMKLDAAASGGLRASEQIRQVLAELRTHITRNGIAISGASQKIKEDGTWIGPDDMSAAFKSVVDELFWWVRALKTAHQTAAFPA